MCEWIAAYQCYHRSESDHYFRPNPSVCVGSTSANLTYSATTATPDQYSINFNAAAEAQGLLML